MSLTLTAKLVELEFACVSLVEHEMVVAPSGNVEPEAGPVHDTGRAPSTMSVAVGVAYVTTAPDGPVAWAVTSETAESEGGVVSWTVTEKLPGVVCGPSLAVQLTVVVPSGKVEPEDGVHEMDGGLATASNEVGENVTSAPAGPVASVVISGLLGAVGAIVSTTVTLKLVEPLLLPLASDAWHVTVVVPSGNVEPDEGEHETVGLGSTTSVELNENVTSAPEGLVASTPLMSPWEGVLGAVVSVTVTVKSADDV